MSDDTSFIPVNYNEIDWQGPDVGMVNYRRGNNVVFFFNKPVVNPVKSRELGRPFSDDAVYIKMHAPGEHNLNVIERPVQDADKRRYPVEWAQFKNNQEQIAPGTQIELLFADTPAIAANLRASGVHTVEQLANLSGTAIDRVGMGGQQWVNTAKEYLESAQKGVHYTHMNHELKQRDGTIRTLENKINMLEAQLNKLAANGQQAGPQLTQAQLAQLLSGMMGTPQFPPPGVPQTPAFDAQSAQIAATHPSNDEAKARRRPGRPRKVGSQSA